LTPLPVAVINQPDRLDDAVRELSGADIIALDTESNSRHHYPEQLCLIQIASRSKVYIIDTICLHDLNPLRNILADVLVKKVIHSADYDVRCLDRRSGLRVRNLFDPGIAARFTGVTRFGLAYLIRDILGISIEKSERLQRSDWGLRPLSIEALDYAADDVRYLIALQEILEERLKQLGRETWVTEECARIEEINYTAPDPETAFLSIKGSDDLDGHALAILQNLFIFREKEALRLHRPPFYILSDETLIFLATHPVSDLAEVPGLRKTRTRQFEQELRQAIHNGLGALSIHRPPRIKYERPSDEQLRRLHQLKEWRISLGVSLSLDPSLLWPLTSLDRLARAPDTLTSEIASDKIRQWQREVVAPSLQSCLKSMR
jgi:ribonuclease D